MYYMMRLYVPTKQKLSISVKEKDRDTNLVSNLLQGESPAKEKPDNQ